MPTFKAFLERSEEDEDILATLAKIPASHAGLVRGFTFKFQGGNTLDGDDDHIGFVEKDPKVIVVAAPWNYGRQFTLLHEIGHRVYETLPDGLKRRWGEIVARTRGRVEPDLDPSPEEMFCMAYAQFYAKNKLKKFACPEWHNFINGLK